MSDTEKRFESASHYCEQCGRVVSCRLWCQGHLVVATALKGIHGYIIPDVAIISHLVSTRLRSLFVHFFQLFVVSYCFSYSKDFGCQEIKPPHFDIDVQIDAPQDLQFRCLISLEKLDQAAHSRPRRMLGAASI